MSVAKHLFRTNSCVYEEWKKDKTDVNLGGRYSEVLCTLLSFL